jgi:flagellar biosynthesis/type III secretory pathway M-ring protein FliF/YscJ
MEKYMNKKVGMYASLITFLGALCFSIFSLLSSLLDHNTFRIGNHLSCILIALGFIGMICSYVTFIKYKNKTLDFISLAFSIIYAIIIITLSFIWVMPKQYSNLSSKTSSILYNFELLGYAFMTISSFFMGIKLEIKNKKELVLKKLLCFQILFSIIWLISKDLLLYLFNFRNISLILLMIEIWCIYIILICIFSYLYFKNQDYAHLNKENYLKQINENGKNNLLKNPIRYISAFWSKLAVIQKIILVSIIIVIAGCFVALYTFPWIPLWTPVFSFPIKDKEVLDRIILRINHEDVKVKVTINGIVQVSDESTARRIRAILIIENLIPSGISPWEIFDKERWIATDFTNDVNFRRAQTNMLTEHIKAIEDIDNVNVVVIVPERDLFRSDQEPITASVIITPKPGSDITTNLKKIEGIQNILKFAIEGLKDKNIIITDQNGIVLNDFISMDAMDRLNISEREQKLIQQLEAKYRADILRQLQAIYESERIRDLFIRIEMDMQKKAIERIFVSVRIDGKWEFKYDEKYKFIILPDGSRKREYIPISYEELRAITMLIQEAISYNRNRGDSVTVHNIPFNRSKQFADEDAAYFRWQKKGIILFFLFGLVIISIIIKIILSIIHYKRTGYYTFRQDNNYFDPAIEYYQYKKTNLKRIENITQINETKKENLFKKLFKYISFFWSKFVLIQKIFFISIIITISTSIVLLHKLTLTPVFSSQIKDYYLAISDLSELFFKEYILYFPIRNKVVLNNITDHILSNGKSYTITANGFLKADNPEIARQMRTSLIIEGLIPSKLYPFINIDKETERAIRDTLDKVAKKFVAEEDEDGNGETNCVDAALWFYFMYPYRKGVKLAVNDELQHAFNTVKIGDNWRFIEPQAFVHSKNDSYFMEDLWGSQYDSRRNEDGDYLWFRFGPYPFYKP